MQVLTFQVNKINNLMYAVIVVQMILMLSVRGRNVSENLRFHGWVLVSSYQTDMISAKIAKLQILI